jgi:hypothetical protein
MRTGRWGQALLCCGAWGSSVGGRLSPWVVLGVVPGGGMGGVDGRGQWRCAAGGSRIGGGEETEGPCR